MLLQKLYPKLSRICFIALLFLLSVYAISSKFLPKYSEDSLLQHTSCYWRPAFIWYIDCGKEVPFGSAIEFFLNKSYLTYFILLAPKFLLLCPPIWWLFAGLFYFFALSYPLTIIWKKVWGSPSPKAQTIYFRIIKWLFILLAIASLSSQGKRWFSIEFGNSLYFSAKTGITIKTPSRKPRAYWEAILIAIERNELDILKKLYVKEHADNPELLQKSIASARIDFVDFFTANGTPITNLDKHVAARGASAIRCETRKENLEMLNYLIARGEKFEDELLFIPVNDLCYPSLEALLRAGTDPNIRYPSTKQSLEEKIEAVEIKKYDSLSERSLQEQSAYKEKMITLIKNARNIKATPNH